MTEDNKGRGVFAKEDLNEGNLILVEKSLAEYTHQPDYGLDATTKKSLQDIMYRDLVM